MLILQTIHSKEMYAGIDYQTRKRKNTIFRKRDEQESKGQDFFGKRYEQVKQRKTELFGKSMVKNRHWFTGLSGE